MGQPLAVYAIASLLLVAGAGPALQAVRDDSLREFETLEEWRSLDDFPFLKSVRPHLPPLVVDWIIVQRDDLDAFPPGVDHRLDEDGRVVLIWPDGCEETQESYEAGSQCDPDAPPDACADNATAEACDPCRSEPRHPDCTPPECPAGQVVDPEWPDADPACIDDPECEEGGANGTRPAHCPAIGDPDPPCDEGEVKAYDGSCVLVVTKQLKRVFIDGNTNDFREVGLELKVPYENLSIELEWRGLTNPGWQLRLFDGAGMHICWVDRNGNAPGHDCNPTRGAGRDVVERGAASYIDNEPGPIAAQNLTFRVQFESGPTGGEASLDVRLYGRPAEA